MDLDSPFEKVALVKSKTGEVEKREIKKARLLGANVELEKKDGSMALFPLQDVVAILPILPQGSADSCTPEQADGATQMLKKATPDQLKQAGLDADQIQAWESLKARLMELKTKMVEEEKRKKEFKAAEDKAKLDKEIEDWLVEAKEFRVSRPEKEFTELKQAGEVLARKSPARTEEIVEALAVLSQAQPKEKGEVLPELSKLTEVQPKLIPDDLLGWLAGGVLVLSFFGILFGLAFLSSSLTRFKEGALLGGIVFGALGLGLLGVLTWTWLPAAVAGQSVAPRADPKLEELGIYLKNRAKPVYYFPKKQFSFSMEEWKSGVLAYLPASEEAVGLFKVKMKQGELHQKENRWSWQQPLTALGIPLPLSLTFQGQNPDLKDWENPTLTGVYLGRWALPEAIAGLLKDSAFSIWKQGLASAGLGGISLERDPTGIITISVPAAGVRPKYELAKEEVEATPSVGAYKRDISAEELAKAIVDGKGIEFLNKFVVIHGEVHSVGGSNFSSAGKVARDHLDDIYLLGIADFYGVGRPMLIKCQVKSDIVFQMDSRGDLYMRYVEQEFEQDRKRAKRVDQLMEDKKIIFKTIDDVEVTSPDIDPAKERPIIYKGRRLQFLAPQRVELKASEVASGVSEGGVSRRPPGTNPAGEIELYGAVLAPKAKVTELISEKEP
jgi:hypothetical protein